MGRCNGRGWQNNLSVKNTVENCRCLTIDFHILPIYP
nr:MAG TPA: hypothetical protein [Caudoviricetes sp.]